MTTTNHKDIGILYFVGSLYFGFIGAVLAILMRMQLSSPLNDFLGASAYNQAISLHGLIMILFFLSPLGIAFGNYFVPLQIGAEDLALPRLNAMSYWLYVIGGFVMILGFFMPGGNTQAGWTSYEPLGTAQFNPGAGPSLAFTGLIMLTVSLSITSINFLLTVVYMRAPGITWRRIPMLTWFILFMILQAIFAFPSLLSALLLLMSDRVLGTFYFVSASGGWILWVNLFWFFGHPEVYIVLLPAFGVIAEVLPVFAGRPLAEKNLILLATGAVIIPLSYLVWEHHMFITGINLTEDQAFSLSTLLISIPFDIVILSFIKTLTKASIRLSVPMLFALGAIVLFIIGGITGVFLSSYVLDMVWNESYFVIAHFHYIMVGTSIYGLFAGIYYFLPRLTGRMYNDAMGKVHFIVSFVGFNVLYFPMFFLYEMPRRIYTYQSIPSWDLLNLIATIGAFIFAMSNILLVVNIVWTARRGPVSIPNPWGAKTLEWTPNVMGGSTGSAVSTSDPHPAALPYFPGGAENPGEHASARPVQLSLGLGISMVGISLLVYYLVGWFVLAVGLAIIAYGAVGWGRDEILGKFKIPDEITEHWPLHGMTKMRVGMWFLIATEIIIFGAIIGSDIYVRQNSAVWIIPGTVHDIPVGLWSSVVLITSGFTALLSQESIRAGSRRGLIGWLSVTLALAATFLALHAYEWWNDFYVRLPNFTPASGLPGSTYFFTVGLHAAHVFVGAIIVIYLIRRAMVGGFTKDSHTGVELFVLFWLFVDIVWMFLFPLFYLV